MRNKIMSENVGNEVFGATFSDSKNFTSQTLIIK